MYLETREVIRYCGVSVFKPTTRRSTLPTVVEAHCNQNGTGAGSVYALALAALAVGIVWILCFIHAAGSASNYVGNLMIDQS